MIVVGVKFAALLLAVQRHVGGVDVEHQFGRRGGKRSDELIDQHRMQGSGLLGRGACFEPAQRRGAGQRPVPAHGRLHQRIGA